MYTIKKFIIKKDILYKYFYNKFLDSKYYLIFGDDMRDILYLDTVKYDHSRINTESIHIMDEDYVHKVMSNKEAIENIIKELKEEPYNYVDFFNDKKYARGY